MRPVGTPATRTARTWTPSPATAATSDRPIASRPDRAHEAAARPEAAEPARGRRRAAALAEADPARDVGAPLEVDGRGEDDVEHEVADDDDRRTRLGGPTGPARTGRGAAARERLGISGV